MTNDPMQSLISRIAARLKGLGLTEREASMRATGQPDAIRYIRARRHMPSAPRLAAIARTLETSPSYLLGETNQKDAVGDPTSEIQDLRTKGYDIPRVDIAPHLSDEIAIYGSGQPFSVNGAQPEKRPSCMGFIIDRAVELNIVQYPNTLAGYRGLYGIYELDANGVRGDVAIIDPDRAPSVGDRILGYLEVEESGSQRPAGEAVVLARLSRKAEGGYWIGPDDPAQSILIRRFTKIHRVLTLREILGA